MRVALVYDRLNKIGGAEQVLQAFHELYPDAAWFTSVWDPKRAPFSKQWPVRASFLNKIPFLRTRHELIPYLMPFAFESFDLNVYDLVISIGSAESKGVLTKPTTLHLNYCLTPTRYLWSHATHYVLDIPAFLRRIGNYTLARMRRWDLIASQRPDVMISISEHVKNRVKKYYKLDTTVIYPPVETTKFNALPVSAGDYYLVVSRLVPYKNIDLVVRAFNKNGKKLVIIGTGSQLNTLKRLAQPNISLVGQVDEVALLNYYTHAKAFIQANIEDFGISMVESLASGKPVIAYRKGGTSEIVNSQTGVLYNELSVGSLNSAVVEFEKKTFSPSLCRQQAAKFDQALWKKAIKQRIIKEWQKHKKVYG